MCNSICCTLYFDAFFLHNKSDDIVFYLVCHIDRASQWSGCMWMCFLWQSTTTWLRSVLYSFLSCLLARHITVVAITLTRIVAYVTYTFLCISFLFLQLSQHSRANRQRKKSFSCTAPIHMKSEHLERSNKTLRKRSFKTQNLIYYK